VQVTNLVAARAVATGGQHSVAIAPAASVAMLVYIIQSMNLPEATITPLINLLGATQSAVGAGHTSAACGQLTGFERLVQHSRGLTAPQATTLLSYARRVETTLGCSARP
jgi:hypothetical protein